MMFHRLKVSSPRIRNKTLVTHRMAALAVTTLFLFQMAMLGPEPHMGVCL